MMPHRLEATALDLSISLIPLPYGFGQSRDSIIGK